MLRSFLCLVQSRMRRCKLQSYGTVATYYIFYKIPDPKRSFTALLKMENIVVFLAAFSVLVPGHLAQTAKPDDKVNATEGIAVGIDLGTTYSCVAVMRKGKVDIIPNDQGNRITPSYVAFPADNINERLVGDAAKNQLTSNPQNTVFDVKRLIGRTWFDPAVQSDLKFYPFAVVDKDDKPLIKIESGTGAKLFTPEEISAMVLKKMKESAESFLGEPVNRAVITVPAYFNDAQRQATKDAGKIAGLEVMRIINEPTAAAVAYGLDKSRQERTILIFDLGGGTFDVSLLAVDNGVFEVLATNGNTHLGGEDFDQRMMDYLVRIHLKKTGRNLRSNLRAMQKLRREAEKAKRTLSYQHEVKVEIESLMDGDDFSEVVSRAKFEELNADLFRSCLEPVRLVLQDANIAKANIDDVVLVGGSTRIPKIRKMVADFFDGKRPNTGINPDEAIAYGAAVQAGILSGQTGDDIVILDINPLTLGTETVGGLMETLIPRNTVIPTRKSKRFTTTEDNQDSVSIGVYEGERPMVEDNHFLGSFDLTDIAPAPKEVPQIKVTFEIDANGILRVTAEDLANGNKEAIVIKTTDNRPSAEEIDRMIKDAEKFAEEDKRKRERVDARNDLESYLYSLKLNLGGKLGKVLSVTDKKVVLNAIETAISWLETNADASKEKFVLMKTSLKDEVRSMVAKAKAQGEQKKDGKTEL